MKENHLLATSTSLELNTQDQKLLSKSLVLNGFELEFGLKV